MRSVQGPGNLSAASLLSGMGSLAGTGTALIAAAIFSAVLSVGLSAVPCAHAQNQVVEVGSVNTTRGISGDEDKHSRNPTLSVSHQMVQATATEPQRVKILADAFTADSSFSKYPIRFDFFVNRKLFSTQMRSVELPGSVGVDIGTDIATPPFNYSVVATVLHPNRSFTTVLNGAVELSDLARTLDCSLTKASAEGDDVIFQASDVQSEQKSADMLGLKYNATSQSGGEVDEVVTSFTLGSAPSATETGDLSISGTLSTSGPGKDVSVAVEGTATFTNGAITGIEVGSSDDAVSLSCSEAAAA